MTTQKLILKLYFISHIAKEKGLIVLGKLQMIDALTPGIDGRCFLAYNLESMYSERCDRPLRCLTAFQYYMTPLVGVGGIWSLVGREWESFMAFNESLKPGQR